MITAVVIGLAFILAVIYWYLKDQTDWWPGG